MSFAGMDPVVMRNVATRLQVESGQLLAAVSAVEQLLAEAQQSWEGDDQQTFHMWWHSQYRPRLQDAAAAVTAMATTVERNVAEQEAVSAVSGGAGSNGAATPTGPRGPDHLKTLLDTMDKSAEVIGIGATFATRFLFGRFAPRDALGRFVSPATVGARTFHRMVEDSRNWVAKPGMSGPLSRWESVGKWAGRAGYALSFGTSAYDQWQADADDPSVSGAERYGRAATVGGSAAGGAWAGAWAGATAGAAIGSVFPGPGTAIGGFVGGAVGGIAGSEAGKALGEALAEPVGDATEAVADVIGDGAGALADGASSLADAATFWD